MNQIYLLYACNGWKEKSSMHLILATTIQETLEGAIAKAIEDGDMGFAGLEGKKAMREFRRSDLDYSGLDYGYVEVVGDGEWQ